MKRFLVILIVLGLILTGCAGINKPTKGEESPKEVAAQQETKEPVQSEETEPASESAENSTDESNTSNDNTAQDAGGNHTWQIGGNTLTTKIDVMDYIDGNVWYANEMAAALGWDPIAMKIDGSYDVSTKSKKPANFKSNGLIIYYSDAGSKCNGVTGYIEGGNLTFNISVGANGDYSYRMNDADFCWTIEEIVCFAYAMENMTNRNDPFVNVLNGSNSSYVINQ